MRGESRERQTPNASYYHQPEKSIKIDYVSCLRFSNFEKKVPTWLALLDEDEIAELPVALLLMIGFLLGCEFVLEDVEEVIDCRCGSDSSVDKSGH